MRPPSWEQIDKVIKKTGMNKYHFELYFGINHNHLAQVMSGQRNLSVSYWHIIYEFGKKPKKINKDVPKVIPQARCGSVGEYVHERFAILK